MKFLKYSLFTVAILAAGVGAAFLALKYDFTGDFNLNYRASEDARQALQSDSEVLVTQGEWIAFQPANRSVDTAMLLYPGGGTEPAAYAPILRQIAAQGYLTIVPHVPSYWSIFANEKLLAVRQNYPQIKHWVVAGHSMGGASAMILLDKHPKAADGLIMWDSYGNERLAYTDTSLPVMSIYATAHHNPERPQIFAQAKQYLPANTKYVPVEGGDHFQYGNFLADDIRGLNTATISVAEQQRQIIAATLDFLRQIEAQ